MTLDLCVFDEDFVFQVIIKHNLGGGSRLDTSVELPIETQGTQKPGTERHNGAVKDLVSNGNKDSIDDFDCTVEETERSTTSSKGLSSSGLTAGRKSMKLARDPRNFCINQLIRTVAIHPGLSGEGEDWDGAIEELCSVKIGTWEVVSSRDELLSRATTPLYRKKSISE
ncbi:hypothetical protein BDR22DRAFT_819562 [Usnea florida]